MAGRQKEMQFSTRIGAHDYAHKLRSIQRFLKHHDTVLVRILFKGREISHQDLGQQLIERLLKDLPEARPQAAPKVEGRSL